MNDLSNYFGLVVCALLCGALVGLFLPSRRTRIAVAALVAGLALIPWSSVPSSSLANRVFAFYDVPSVSTLFIATFALWKPTVKIRVGVLGIVVPCVFGLLLYLSEFNVLSVDLYRFGYAPLCALVVSGVAVLFGSPVVFLIACVADVLHALGVYANFFDAILDVPFWLGMTGYLVVLAIRRLVGKKEA